MRRVVTVFVRNGEGKAGKRGDSCIGWPHEKNQEKKKGKGGKKLGQPVS